MPCRFYSFMRYVSVERITEALLEAGLLKEWEVSDFLEQITALDIGALLGSRDGDEDEWWEDYA